MQSNYNRRHKVVEGEEISAGDRVWIADMQTEGVVIRRHGTP